jgi:outer membrane protein assembly factor BamB
MKREIGLIILATIVGTTALAQNNIVTWRGPVANAVYNEKNLLGAWPEAGPQLVWSDTTAGIGYTTPILVNNQIFSLGMIESTGYLMCYSIDGKKLWQKPYGAEYMANVSYMGSRGNLRYDNGSFYYLSGIGEALKIDVATGSVLWRTDLTKEFKAPAPKFGACEMPQIVGNEVTFTPGTTASMAVLDKNSGKLIRKSPARGDLPGYSSALLADHKGRKIWFTHTKENFYAVDYLSADTLFSISYAARTTDNTNTPTYFPETGELFITQFSEHGAKMLKLSDDGKSYTEKWKNPAFDVKIGGYVVYKGHIYGPANGKKQWMCIDIATGTTKYAERTLPIGCVVMADDMLYCYSETGDMALVKPTPEKFDVVSSFKAFNGPKQFTNPLIANGQLILRYQNTIKVFDISKK